MFVKVLENSKHAELSGFEGGDYKQRYLIAWCYGVLHVYSIFVPEFFSWNVERSITSKGKKTKNKAKPPYLKPKTVRHATRL